MENIFGNTQALRAYLAAHEVVYQIADELISVSNDSEPENRVQLLRCFDDSKECRRIDKATAAGIYGFTEVAGWSTEDDTLIYCDGGMVICLPKGIYSKGFASSAAIGVSAVEENS